MHCEDSLKERVLSGLLWKFMESGGARGVQFIVSLVLARLLLPRHYGLIAIITIFITIGNVFVNSGFSSSLIQKKNVDETDLSTVFFITLGIAAGVYLVLFLAAPAIAEFFNEPLLSPILRVLSLTLLLGPPRSLQNVLISRTMKFKRLFFSSMGGIIVSGIVGITMAYNGFGVWSLVGQSIANELSTTLILWFTVKWRPKLLFSFQRSKALFSYGSKLLLSSILDVGYSNIYGLVIGKLFRPDVLGFYSRGDQFPYFIISNIDSSIQSVLFPALSSQQDDKARVKDMVRRSIVTSSFIIFPIMVGLAVCAEPLVKVLLTDKWLPCVPFLQMMCLAYILWPIHTANLQAINALGHSEIFLKLEIIKKCIGVATLAISIPFGIYVMVAFKPINSLISSIINSHPNKRLLDYSIREQWMDVFPSLALSFAMGGVVYLMKFLGWSYLSTLIIQVITGAVFYLVVAYLLKLECFIYLLYSLRILKKERAGAN